MCKGGGWGPRWQSDGTVAWENLIGTSVVREVSSSLAVQGIVGASAAQEAPQDDGMGYLRWTGLKGQHSLGSCGPGAYKKIVASPKVGSW